MKISTTNAEHYTWGGSCDGWHLLKSPTLGVIQEKMPPGSSEQMHYHEHAQQLFFILEGVATFESDAFVYTVTKGEAFHIMPGKKHRILNDGLSDLEFLVISEPHSHGDRVDLK